MQDRGIFNNTQKPSKSVDLSSGPGDTGLPENDDEILRQLNQMTQDLMNENQSIFLLSSKERVEQVECGSIHTVVRTSLHKLFSCGNGSTFALGHGSRET
jgi:alpha-tubulin suppressor-like RCC1 family protein